jgi:hypothetical protein
MPLKTLRRPHHSSFLMGSFQQQGYSLKHGRKPTNLGLGWFRFDGPYPTCETHFTGRITRFYEKVVKVKADVAAILNFFSHSIRQIEVDDLGAAPTVSIGGMRKGGFSGAL